MSTIDIDRLYAELNAQLSQAMRDRIDMKVVGESGLSVEIGGENCLTAIGVWPNGCCDVDFLFVLSGRGDFTHFEFQSTEAAIAPVLSEIQLALERG